MKRDAVFGMKCWTNHTMETWSESEEKMEANRRSAWRGRYQGERVWGEGTMRDDEVEGTQNVDSSNEAHWRGRRRLREAPR